MKKIYTSKHLKTILTTLFLVSIIYISNANTYYSIGSLSVSSTLSWRDALGISPTGFNLTDTFVIKNTHTMYVGSNWKVTGLNSTIIIENGGILKANDSINLNSSTTFNIKDGGSYIHMNNSFAPTSIFNGIEVFEARSNVEINNWYDYKTPITVNKFGNLKITYNPSDIWNQENNISLIQGNFFLDNRSRNAFQFANNSNHTVTINKNFIIKSGVFNFSGAYSKIYRLNIKGGFIQNGGVVSHQSPSGILGIFTMNFTGDSSFIYRTGGTYRILKINYSVDTNAKFYMTRRMQIPIGRSFSVNGTLLCDTFTMFGSGSFILQPNAFLYVGADSGIYRVGSRKGNILTLLRSYSTNANYIYYGKNNQSTGNGIPNVVKSLTVDLINPTYLLVLKKSINISQILDLKNGVVKTDTSKLILGTSTTNLGTLIRTNGYVFGEFGRYFGNTTNIGITGLMPIGVGNYYRPNSIEFTQAPLLGGLIMSKFYTNDPGSAGLPLTDAGKDIIAASYNGFWSIAPVNGNFTNGIYTNTLYPNNFSDILDVSALHIIVRNPGNMWTLNGTHITPIGSTSSPIVSRTNMTTFGEFGISFHNTNSTLPVSWNSFNVESIDNDAILTWSTNLEINNEYFEIEKSIDAVNFEKIGEVKGAGNSSILNNYNYTDVDAKNNDAKTLYYRIKQIDTDKKYTYTDIKFIEINKTNIQAVNTVEIYPNPSSDFIKINASTEIKYISVVSLQGNIVFQTENFGTNGLIDISNFSNNMYLVTVLYTDNSTTTNRIIKN